MGQNILFAFDLDNTLIRSARLRREGDVCVVRSETEGLTYMPAEVVRMLSSMGDDIRFIPVTSRRLQQYSRIQWPDGLEPEYAVINGGAILLRSGEPVDEWAEEEKESWRAFCVREEPVLSAWFAARGAVLRQAGGYYLYAVAKDQEQAKGWLRDARKELSVPVILSKRKLYFLPDGLNKGTAVRRLRKMFCPHIVVGAGDSRMDVPMLKESDYAIVPNTLLSSQLPGVWVAVCPEDRDFPVFVMEKAMGAAERWSRT